MLDIQFHTHTHTHTHTHLDKTKAWGWNLSHHDGKIARWMDGQVSLDNTPKKRFPFWIMWFPSLLANPSLFMGAFASTIVVKYESSNTHGCHQNCRSLSSVWQSTNTTFCTWYCVIDWTFLTQLFLAHCSPGQYERPGLSLNWLLSIYLRWYSFLPWVLSCIFNYSLALVVIALQTANNLKMFCQFSSLDRQAVGNCKVT